MRVEVTLKEAVGKTLQGFVSSFTAGQMVLTFTDGTFTTVGIKRGWEHCDDEIEGLSLRWHDFGDEDLIKLGVVTIEELDAMHKQRK